MRISVICRVVLALLVTTCLPLAPALSRPSEKDWNMPPGDAQKWKDRVSKLCPPTGWTVTVRGNAIVIQRDKPVWFASNEHLINAPAVFNVEESKGSRREGHYRLTLQFAPKVSQDTFEKLSAENDRSETADLQLRDKYRVGGKFGIIRSYTEDQKKREQAYRVEAKKLIWHRLPHLYSTDYSIHFYHSWSWLEYLAPDDKAAHEECEDVWQGIEKLFGEYDPDLAAGRGGIGQSEGPQEIR